MSPSKQISFLIGSLRKAWNVAIVDRFHQKVKQKQTDTPTSNCFPSVLTAFLEAEISSHRSTGISQSLWSGFLLSHGRAYMK